MFTHWKSSYIEGNTTAVTGCLTWAGRGLRNVMDDLVYSSIP